MIRSEHLVLRRPSDGAFYRREWRPRDLSGGPPYGEYVVEWKVDKIDAGQMYPNGRPDQLQNWRDHVGIPDLEFVSAAACACCGAWQGKIIEMKPGSYRCEKHRDRTPCLVDGCKKTGDAAKFTGDLVCGFHWRTVPRRLKDRHRKIRRLAKRRGWTEQLIRIDEAVWRQVVRFLTDPPQEDLPEHIAKVFGWTAKDFVATPVERGW